MSSRIFLPVAGRTAVGRRAKFRTVAAFLALLCITASAQAAPGPWDMWWLPKNYSTHGGSIDSLFDWIYWITFIAFIGVESLLVIFLIKYRRTPGRRKAHFTHGNTRLEMAWTIVPAVILAGLAMGSKRVWDCYRYSPMADDPTRAHVLVIGQQFKWNFIYPGPDGKFGRYLIFPRPTDTKWPVGIDGRQASFRGVPGPASLPHDEAIAAINAFIDSNAGTRLGKDFTDPNGADDDYQNALMRELTLPVNRPIEVELASKDVIHDFFLPNFRVKLDAVPGMRGHLYFQATMTSAEHSRASARNIRLDELEPLLASPDGSDLVILIDESAPGTSQNKNQDRTGWRYINPATPRTSIIRNGMAFGDLNRSRETIAKLREAGLSEVRVSDSGLWELICEQLCGLGHNTMTAPVRVVTQAEYDAKKWDTPSALAPSPVAASTAPTLADARTNR